MSVSATHPWSTLNIPIDHKAAVEGSHICIHSNVFFRSKSEFNDLSQLWWRLYHAGFNFFSVPANNQNNCAMEHFVQTLPRDKVVIQMEYDGYHYDEDGHPESGDPDVPRNELTQKLGQCRAVGFVDIFLVRGPLDHPETFSQLAAGLARCVGDGLADSVGVSNFQDPGHVQQLYDALNQEGVQLSTFQGDLNNFRRRQPRCQRDGRVIFQSIAQSSGNRTELRGHLGRGQTFHALCRIANRRQVSALTVALNYMVVKGFVPVVDVRTDDEVEQVIEATGWRLSQREIEEIDRA
ncbi:NADP-dependent oxidoreductase domain-containing protein [Podospora didyma]|uniref:NADP-dependent oxidoreductase domain-containing protein n=1 Tax=Podospora didyma TaxID=330526 RepID=A0AAE0K2D2_9PEZI|nr:NADP-dependent oxidoreductase domain-containing protein [Podospora didyma]